MQDFTIERVGQPDLVFTGDLIGKSDGPKPSVKFYRTKGGKFIAEIAADAKRSRAKDFTKPAEVVDWLKVELRSITPDAQAAIEDAAKNDDSFKSFWTVRVE